MINPARGEVAIRLAGKDYALRPSMAFIAEVEGAIGPLTAQFAALREGTWKVTDLIAIVQAGLRHERGLGEAAIAEAVFRAGPGRLREAALALVAQTLMGEEDEAEAAEAATGTEAGASEAAAGNAPGGPPAR